MFNPGKVKIKIAALENGSYALGAVHEDGRFLNTNYIRRLLFNWDDASFYGTKMTTDTVEGNPVFILDAWGLLNFFALESFNSFVEWEWSDLASLCLSAAPVLHESIEAAAKAA